jgi:hypothetical protein
MLDPSQTMGIPQPETPVAYLHMAHKGAFRLGMYRNSLEDACMFVLTFGFSQWFWFTRTLSEISFHTQQVPLPLRRYSWLILIPGVHMGLYYCLAAKIRAMEEENGEATTSPLIASVLSLFPFFSIWYLQAAMNRHWVWHVKCHRTTSAKTTLTPLLVS